jgi:GAF domain-containing protein
MQAPPLHPQEQSRVEALHKMALLDSPSEERFDLITREAKERFNVLLAAITLIDESREWYKSCAGGTQTEGPREISFCGHALLANDLFIVGDTLKDVRFADNPQVVNPPHIRFYAGVALHEKDSFLPVGVFCIKDDKPRQMTAKDISVFLDLAQRAEQELNVTPPLLG